RRAASAARSDGPGACLRCDTMGGEPTYTMLRFGLVLSELSLSGQKSPAIMRPIYRTRVEKSRALRPQSLRSKKARSVVQRLQIALCEVARKRHGWFDSSIFNVRPRAPIRPRRRPRSICLPTPEKCDRFACI